ncbi:FH1/FH2 domain-containing protein 3-like [Platysternon megacephalum]|uniref:FH1/FH2 domain-containing protein 3-like n=1 Tax=Platysternon megacephalum TaxID=55544 RepID=A0A4D9EQX3_9SAUR|nr:FH1/FH2 domain-containing protein 3-like [Platysternon megacephalum]
MEPTESFHQRRLVSNLVVESFKSSSDADVKHTLFWRFRRRDTEFCAYIRRLLQNPLLNSMMISIISLNAVFLALETDYAIKFNSYAYLESLITALGQTVKTVIYVLILLFLLMFIFAILGYGLYGDPETGDSKNWGNLASALFTLFCLVTVISAVLSVLCLSVIETIVDGWTDFQNELDQHGFSASRAFTIVFILLGFFLFFNMSIGVVIMNIQDSTQNYERELKAEKQAALRAKKQAILQRQQEEVNMLMHQQVTRTLL